MDSTFKNYKLHGSYGSRSQLIQYLLMWLRLVDGVSEIVWAQGFFKKLPNLYVEIKVEESVQRTKTAKGARTPSWKEDFYL